MTDTDFPDQLAEMEAEQCGEDPGAIEADRGEAAWERLSAAIDELYQLAPKDDMAAAVRAAILRADAKVAASNYGLHRANHAIESMRAAWDASNKRIFETYEAQRRG